MKRLVNITLICLSTLLFNSCWFFYDDYPKTYTYSYVIYEFEEGFEQLQDNAWAYYDSRTQQWSYPRWSYEADPDYQPEYAECRWLVPPCHLFGRYYMWRYFYQGINPYKIEQVVFLTTSREEWNAGNHAVHDSLIAQYCPFTENYGVVISDWAGEIEQHFTRIYDTIKFDTIDNLPYWYPANADTAWFRDHIYFDLSNHLVKLK